MEVVSSLQHKDLLQKLATSLTVIMTEGRVIIDQNHLDIILTKDSSILDFGFD